MIEMHVVRGDNSHLYEAELDQYFRGRYEVYVRERGWKDLERPDGRDIDQFDTEEAVHILAVENKEVVGGRRMNPTTSPTLLSEVFPNASLLPLIRSPDVFETSRLWVARHKRGDRTRPRVESLLHAATMEFALAAGLSKTRTLFETWWIPRFQRIGWKMHPLGLPLKIDGLNCIAVTFEVAESIWVETCVKGSVPGPVLIWHGTTQPAYHLPELAHAVA